MDQREAWGSLLKELPDDVPLSGVVHLAALDGHGAQAMTGEMAEDVRRAGASALALVQAVADSDMTPEKGVWFITRGAQVLERERGGELAGAALWGFGKAVAREAAHLQPRMIDLDPGEMAPAPDLVNELLYPDSENHIAYRGDTRRVARLIRMGAESERLSLPEEPDWVLAPDPDGVFREAVWSSHYRHLLSNHAKFASQSRPPGSTSGMYFVHSALLRKEIWAGKCAVISSRWVPMSRPSPSATM